MHSVGAGRGVVALIMTAVISLTGPSTSSAEFLGESGGFHYLSETRAGTGFFTVTANCPSGQHVMGGGFRNTQVTRTEPTDGADRNRRPDDAWTISAYKREPGEATAFAICSRIRPEYIQKARSLGGSRPSQTLIVRCPEGTKVISGGGAIRNDRGNDFLSWSNPHGGTFRDPDPDGWIVRGDERRRSEGVLRATAVCLDANPAHLGAARVVHQGETAYQDQRCPDSMHVVGLGGRTDATANRSALSALEPLDYEDEEFGADTDAVPDDIAAMRASLWSDWIELIEVHVVCLPDVGLVAESGRSASG